MNAFTKLSLMRNYTKADYEKLVSCRKPECYSGNAEYYEGTKRFAAQCHEKTKG